MNSLGNFADRKPRGSGLRPAWLPSVFVLVFAAAQLQAETTIYVGKHFEVRDHDAPVKYVFNGNTRVARVTGSLSTNERIQRFRLRAGWNLASLAVTAPDFLGQLREFTSGPAPVIKALYRWQPATRDYGTIASGESVAAGTVLWVSAQTDAVVAVRGGYVEATEWRAPPSGTFVAVPALEAQPLTVPPGVTIWRYDAENRRWQAGLTGDLASLSDLPPTLAPGEAIYVHSNEPADLGAPAPEERIRYYHQDHLGSSSVMTDSDGTLVEETAFYPFGIPRNEHRLRQIEESYKFTQKERDRESGLHYFETRYLAGTLSRFLSVDPKYANIESPMGDAQALNLYAYVANNPLKYTDPTGLDRDSGIGDAVASGIARGLAGGDDKASGAGIAGAAASGIARADGGFDAASLSAGFGDAALDSIDPTFGFFWSGHRLGPTIREGLGINNVNEASGEYAGGAMAFEAVEALVGTGVIKAPFSRGAQTVAKTVGTETSTATKTLVGVPPPPVNPRPSYAAQKVLDRATKTGQLEVVQGTGMTRQQYNTAANAYSNRLMAERRAEMNAVLDAGGSVKSYIAWIGREVRRAFPIGPP